jgi:trk system potassium uptake protein TrkH
VGFNTLPIGALSASSLFLILMLMVIGASPSGTGGGLKTTTFTALMGLIHATLRGETRVTFWGKEIPTERLRVAIASIGFYVMSLLLGCYLLALTENQSLDGLIFEATSALGTVGLSTGITPLLSPLGKITVILLMFVGRLGPLVFGIALFLPPRAVEGEVREDLAV